MPHSKEEQVLGPGFTSMQSIASALDEPMTEWERLQAEIVRRRILADKARDAKVITTIEEGRAFHRADIKAANEVEDRLHQKAMSSIEAKIRGLTTEVGVSEGGEGGEGGA